MDLAFILFFTVVLIILFVANNAKFSKTWRHKQIVKQDTAQEIPYNLQKQGDLRIFFEVLRMLYYRFIEGIPNYEVAQRVMARLGSVIVYKFPFGSMEYRVIGDPVYAKSIMADPSWADRIPVGYYLQDAGFDKPYGLLTGGGKHWKPASRVTVKLLQQLGFFNPATMEDRFMFEMEELRRKLDGELALNGGEHTFCPRDVFGHLSINVVFHILLGKRNPLDEAVVAKLISEITTMNKTLAPFVSLLEIAPFLRHFPRLTFLGYFKETSVMIYDILREVIGEKRRVGKYKEHVEDFVDGMLQHVDKNESYEEGGLNEENMLVVLRDMLFAGADTTSATLEHALLFMSLHPEVQEKVQAEIDDVIGPDRAPSYEDRRRMPYTEATLHEIYRLGSPVPAIARAKHEGNQCLFAPMSVYAIHRNELYFKKPNEFKPERFLSTEDSTKVVNTENVMPFGYGRRSCPGETAARVAVFVYFVVMLQKYWIRPSSQHPPPSMKNTHGFSRSPQHYHITIRRRH